jgi:hypothetical protein
MHHHARYHGPAELIVGGRYTLIWEPDCIYDLGNAMTIVDHRFRIRGYLTRKDALPVSTLSRAECPIQNITCKPLVQAHVVEHHLGPQQECNVQMSIKSKDLAFVKHILASENCSFTVY